MRWSDARAAGLNRAVLDGPDWVAPLRGVRTPSCADPVDPMTRIQEVLAAAPSDAVLTGWSAGFVHGAGDLDGRDAFTGRLHPVTVHVGSSARIRVRSGLRTDRAVLSDDEIQTVDGIHVSSPGTTAWQLARRGPLDDAVVAVDALLRAGVIDMAGVAERVARSRSLRGVRQARRVLELADAGTRSSPETRLRLVWMLDAGLPRPRCNVTVVDDHGFVAGQPDLLDPQVGLVGEYDGAGHRDPVRHRLDNIREEGFESLGLVVCRATAGDLTPAGRGRLVVRLQDAYRRACLTPAAARRWLVRA